MRRTLAHPVCVTGVGLHSGHPCRARLAPAAAGHGLRINGGPVHLSRLRPAPRTTALNTPTGPVSTVEHLLAALVGHGVTDAGIWVEGGEVPALDGSARPLWRAIEPLDLAVPAEPLRLARAVEVRAGDRWLRASPAGHLRVQVVLDYPPRLAQTFTAGLADFALVAGARTFGFRADAEALWAAGCARGASLENTLVLDEAGAPLNAPRFPDEPARHKCLDLFGDLALLGRPLWANVVAHRGGHALHHALVRAILQRPDP